MAIAETYYCDFIGPSTHGELFDFQELTVKGRLPSTFFQSSDFKQAPDYRALRIFYKQKLLNPACSTWKPTPLAAKDTLEFQQILRFGNLQHDRHSSEFLAHKYLYTKGQYYAYFAGYPAGSILYCLVPAENKIFIVRKRG